MHRASPILLALLVGLGTAGAVLLGPFGSRSAGPRVHERFDAPTSATSRPEAALGLEGGHPGLRGRHAANVEDAVEPGIEEVGIEEVEETEVVVEDTPTEEPDEEFVGPDKALDTGSWPGEPGFENPTASRFYDDRVSKALFWLGAHQAPDGRWSAAAFDRSCKGEFVLDPDPKAAGPGSAERDVGVTGLALCAFLGAGYTHRGKHPFKHAVRRGLRFLEEAQAHDGSFGPRHHTYAMHDHAFAALAMLEAHALTQSSIYEDPARRGLEFITKARTQDSGWGFAFRDRTVDTLSTGLLMLPVRSAQRMNRFCIERGLERPFDIDPDIFEDVVEWLDAVTDPTTGRVGYTRSGELAWHGDLELRFPSDKGRLLESLALLSRVYAGQDPGKQDDAKRAASQIASRPPAWSEDGTTVDALYWWIGSSATYMAGGRPWKAWRKTVEPALVETQRDDAWYCRGKGSWDPVGVHGAQLGRVGTTALMTLSLEVYYRYDRVVGPR